MKSLLLLVSCALYACTPKANNANTQQLKPVEEPTPDEGEQEPPTPQPDPGVEPGPGEPVKKPDEELQLKGCSDSNVPGSDHKLDIQLDAATGKYRLDFKNEADHELRVISVYVTGMKDEIPTFENGFKFEGTAYWMVSLDDPFEDFFPLPLSYGVLPDKGVDVTERYNGMAHGAKLATLSAPTCLKWTVITFEPEEAQSFKTSTFLQIHRP